MLRKPPAQKPYAYVNQAYGLNVKPGERVKMPNRTAGEHGTVIRKQSYDHYVHVRFDGQKHDVPVHPLDLEYEVSAC